MRARSVLGAVLVAAGVAIPSIVSPALAGADAGDDPCGGIAAFICRMLPIAPDLDDDIDLTKQAPPVDPNLSAPDGVPPTGASAPAADAGI